MKEFAGEDRRRVSREEGMRLLLAAAMDVARSKGQLEEGVYVNPIACRFSRQSVALCGEGGTLISRVPLQEARRMLAFRRQVARESIKRSGVTINSASATVVERRSLRDQSQELRALAWAISAGRRFPLEPALAKQQRLLPLGVLLLGLLVMLCLMYQLPLVLTVLLLLLLGAGVALLLQTQKAAARYRFDLNNLVLRWRTMGHPDPTESFFAHYDL